MTENMEWTYTKLNTVYPSPSVITRKFNAIRISAGSCRWELLTIWHLTKIFLKTKSQSVFQTKTKGVIFFVSNAECSWTFPRFPCFPCLTPLVFLSPQICQFIHVLNFPAFLCNRNVTVWTHLSLMMPLSEILYTTTHGLRNILNKTNILVTPRWRHRKIS